MASQKRYVWVDYAKFLSIFLVVYFHSPPVLSGMFGASLHFLRMPCFFFLAGLLFRFDKHPTFKQYLVHRSRQLLIPYIWFFLLFYTYWLIIGRKTGTLEDLQAPFYQPIIEYLCGAPRLVCRPLWFVPCLFAMQCLFYLLFKKMNRLWSTLIMFLFPFIPLLVNLENTPFSLDMVCSGIPFYGLASLYRTEIFKLMEQKVHLFIVLLSLLVHVLFCYLLTISVHDFQKVIIEFAGSFSVLLAAFVLLKKMSDVFGSQYFIVNIANNAIIILAFHTYSIIILQRIALWLFNHSSGSFEGEYVLKLTIAVVAMLSMIIPIWFINKYTPFVLGRK